jgi:dipeptidyl aminopeptidase/acylaminoacyl peptidase
VVAVGGARRAGILRPRRQALRRAFVLVIVTLLVAIALVGVAIVGSRFAVPPRPPFPTGNGWIAVSANPLGVGGGEDGDIYRLEPGKAPVRIIGSDGDQVAQACPAFSPDGGRIAYAEARASDQPVTTFRGNWPVQDRAIVIAAAERPDVPLVRAAASAEPGLMLCPTWSPDGRFVAILSSTELSVIDAESGSLDGILRTAIPQSGVAALAWSRDGTRIAIGEFEQIVILRLTNRTERVLPVADGSVRTLAWTADDGGIAYLEDGIPSGTNPEARLIDLSSGREMKLDLPSADGSLTSGAASLIVSPDGRRLAWLEQDARCNANGCDGNFPERLAMFDETGIHAFHLGVSTGSSMRWSPAGDQFLFSSIAGIDAVPLQGGAPQVMASGSVLNLEWSSDEVTWQPLFH